MSRRRSAGGARRNRKPPPYTDRRGRALSYGLTWVEHPLRAGERVEVSANGNSAYIRLVRAGDLVENEPQFVWDKNAARRGCDGDDEWAIGVAAHRNERDTWRCLSRNEAERIAERHENRQVQALKSYARARSPSRRRRSDSNSRRNTVRNPETGRRVRVGGATHRELQRRGVL